MIPIIYEDEWLMVVDKPSGLLVIPSPKDERHTLTNMLNEKLQKEGIAYRMHPCHRLDRDTSGLVIYAKGKVMQQKMMDEFKNRRIKKTYIAFVQGRLSKAQGQITTPIEGQSAVTNYKVIGVGKDFSIVEVSPLTGRKNQIRLHFKEMGNPILGDTRFVFRRNFRVKANRLCLHATTIEFIHPETKQKIQVSSGLPDKMKEFLERRTI